MDNDRALKTGDWKALLELADRFFSTLRFNELLHMVTRETANRMELFRCSIVFMDEKKEVGYVVATNEAPETHRILLDLEKYPEIVHADRSKETVFIPDTLQHSMLKPFKETLMKIRLNSIAIFPLIQGEKILGNLFLKICSHKRFTLREIQFSSHIARLASRAIWNVHHYENLLQEKNHLEKLAMIDFLTETHNHRYFNTRLEEEFNRAVRYNLSLSCILLDVDDFKWINDTYGHRKGDMTLREIAAVVKGTIRKTDFLARYGGEEFVILLPQTDSSGAFREGERIREAVRRNYYPDFDETKKITVSLGVATFPEKGIQTSDELIRAADTALYRAKRNGKDRTERFLTLPPQ